MQRRGEGNAVPASGRLKNLEKIKQERRTCSPSCTKTGRMKLLGSRKVSLKARRTVSLLRLRRGRDRISCGSRGVHQERPSKALRKVAFQDFL